MIRVSHFFFVWLLTLFLIFDVQAQKAERIEKLKRDLAKTATDTAQIRILLNIAMTYTGYQMDSAMSYALQALEKAETIKNVKGRADAILHIGRLKRDQSKDVEALNDMFSALKLYRQIDDKVQIANSLNDISIVYANSGDFENSLDYFKQALEIFRQTGDRKGESYALNNIGIIYQELKDEVSAKDYFIQSLKIKIENNDLYGISRGYTNLGSIAENDQAWDEAMGYYKKADSIFAITNDKQGRGQNHIGMARVQQQQGNTGAARIIALSGFETAKEINDLLVMSKSSKLIAEIDEDAGNYKSALAYQKIYNRLGDSLNNKNHKATLEELKAKFNLEEKEREIALLKKDRELHEVMTRNSTLVTYILSGGIVFLMLISGLIYYAYRTTKTARDSLALKNKEIEQQRNDLDKINKEKDRFFSILSHDLRSPLNALKGLSYLLVHHGDAMTANESKELKNKIDNSLDNLTELINNILEWSMTTSRKRKKTFAKVNTTVLIQNNISLYQSIAETKGVRLIHDVNEDVFGYADHQAIDTVIRNLLSNSIKFSHPKSDVTVKTAIDGNNVLISVRDQGIGIPADLQEKLFTMNGSPTQSGTQNEKGTGIGLLLCKELMKENHGDVSVQSAEGSGSEFFISFPVFEE